MRISRRAFVVGGLLGSGIFGKRLAAEPAPGTARGSASSKRKATGATFDADVLVIGAGAAGIFAAKTLKENGLRPLILEATDRVGGRVMSQSVGNGHFVELGAQWLAAQGQERLSALAQRYRYRRLSNPAEGNSVFLRGERREVSTASEPPMSILGKLDAYRFALSVDRMLQRQPVEAPWKLPALDSLSVDAWLDSALWTDDSKRLWRNTIEQGLCCDLQSVSAAEVLNNLKSIGGLELLGGADAFYFSEGLQNLFVRLVADESLEVLLRSPVTEVRQSDTGVVVHVGSRRFTAAHAIVAVPPQVLKRIAFQPELPPPLATLAGSVVNGSVVKVVAVYDAPWWRGRGFRGMVLSPTETFDLVIDSSKPDSPLGILVGLVSGPRTASLRGRTAVELSETFEAFVRRAFGATEKMRAFHHMDWNTHPFIEGGYSSRRSLNQWVAAADVLQRPHGRLYFAGTETALQWRGYIEGALESGERQARAILAR